jgi:serine/threonine-protein phosphatase 2A regulatory subunit A
VIPIVLRLAGNETNFTSRVSAVQLIPKVYPKAGKMKEQLRNKFNDLSREDTPMVKRAVASKMGVFA